MTVLQQNFHFFGKSQWDKNGKSLSAEQKDLLLSKGVSCKAWTAITTKRINDLTIREIIQVSTIVGIPAAFLIEDPNLHKGITDFSKWC
jgi:hypothetical protein